MRRTSQPVCPELGPRRAVAHQGFLVGTVPGVHAFGVATVVERLRSEGGGYEIVHESEGLELGVYVLVAPEPDRQQPHADDEVYIGLEGSGVLEVGDERVPVRVGEAIFVEAGVEHRFTAYEQLAVLVIFERARG
jgi:mannose-6-phosphate isomerase-like protein (cupin superfamily)